MTWKPRPAKWNWRAYLTPVETQLIREADAALDAARREIRKWSPVRQPIVNRAIHRAKYEAKR